MTITTKQRTGDDLLNTDTDIELEFYCSGKLVGTLTVYNPENGNSYIDYNSEPNQKDYNLLHVEPNGTIANHVPTIN